MCAPPFSAAAGTLAARVQKPPASKACAGYAQDHPGGVQNSLMRVMKLETEDGRVVCERCRLATRPWSRMRGLLGRSSLDPGEGMLFKPASSIHMFFMRFAIDAIFCDADLVVLSVSRELAPWKMASQRGAKVVVEVAAGAAAGVEPGTRLRLGTIDA